MARRELDRYLTPGWATAALLQAYPERVWMAALQDRGDRRGPCQIHPDCLAVSPC